MRLITKYATYIVIAFWAMACYAFFQFCYPNHFFYQEQNQLFLWSSDYLASYLDKPAWMACAIGDFLTQFYYYLYAGAAILTVCLLAVGDFMRRALQRAGVRGKWMPYLIAIVVMTIEALLSLDYGYKLSSVISVAGASFLYWITPVFFGKKPIHTWVSALATLCVSILCFGWFGYGVWVYLALVILACVLHWKKGGVWYHLAAVCLTVIALFFTKKIYYLDYAQLLSYPNMGKFVKPQLSLEKTLDVENAYEFGNYKKVQALVENNPEANQYMKFYYNLAMAKQGLLPQKLLSVPNNDLGTLEQIGPDTPTLTAKSLNALYWELGDMTFAERATLLGTVFSPNNRNIRMTKRLAEISLAKGDQAATNKYLRILGKTFVWKQWAEERLDGNPQALAEYTVKAQNVIKRDTLRLNQNAYMVLLELLQANPENKIALDYLLCTDLLLKNMETFKHDYDAYYLQQTAPQYEKLYQEALAIYLAGTNAPEEEWKRYIHRQDVLQRFAAYNQQRGSEVFRDTYWYYFDKVKAIKDEKTKR